MSTRSLSRRAGREWWRNNVGLLNYRSIVPPRAAAQRKILDGAIILRDETPAVEDVYFSRPTGEAQPVRRALGAVAGF
jgi:hypothetical protein